MESRNRDVSITCACCGRTESPARKGGSGGIGWLRQDVELGLGVCSACPEWQDAWDRGQRDVRVDPGGTGPRQSGGPVKLNLLIEHASLPSFSHVLVEIYDLLSSETAGADRIAQLLQTDAALTARTLQLANSAYYGTARGIGTIQEALTRIGPFDLWWLLFTTEVKSLFFGIDRQLMNMEKFWRHSLLVACVSRTMSEHRRLGEPREMFVAGLIHDIGKLLMLQRIPIEYGALLELAAPGKPLVELERAEFGFTHADAGGKLLEAWNLPGDLVQRVRAHHQDSASLSAANLVAAANLLAHRMDAMAESGETGEGPERPVMDESGRLYRRLVDLVL